MTVSTNASRLRSVSRAFLWMSIRSVLGNWIARHNQLLRFRSNGQPLERSQVAQAFDLAGVNNTGGAPSFAHFAKGGRGNVRTLGRTRPAFFHHISPVPPSQIPNRNPAKILRECSIEKCARLARRTSKPSGASASSSLTTEDN